MKKVIVYICRLKDSCLSYSKAVTYFIVQIVKIISLLTLKSSFHYEIFATLCFKISFTIEDNFDSSTWHEFIFSKLSEFYFHKLF